MKEKVGKLLHKGPICGDDPSRRLPPSRASLDHKTYGVLHDTINSLRVVNLEQAVTVAALRLHSMSPNFVKKDLTGR